MAAVRPQLLLAFKSIHLDQDRLLSLPVPIKVHYSPDDVANPENITPAYLDHEHRWDSVVTTKVHNVPELRARGGALIVRHAPAHARDPLRPCASSSRRQARPLGLAWR